MFTEYADVDFIESLPLWSLSGQPALFDVFVGSMTAIVVFAVCVGAIDDCSLSSPVVCR